MTTLLTIGTFDLTHAGHAAFLRRCERFADRIVVGVNSDRFVETYKGQRPIFDEETRRQLIVDMGYENTRLNDGPGRELIMNVEPDIIAIGSDWARRDYLEQIGVTQDELDRLGCALVYIPYTDGISSSEIKRRMRDESDELRRLRARLELAIASGVEWERDVAACPSREWHEAGGAAA